MKKLKYDYRIENELNLALNFIVDGCNHIYHSLELEDDYMSFYLLCQGIERLGKIALLTELKDEETLKDTFNHNIKYIIQTIKDRKEKEEKLQFDRIQNKILEQLHKFANSKRYEALDQIERDIKNNATNSTLMVSYQNDWNELLIENDKQCGIKYSNDSSQIMEASKKSYCVIIRKIIGITKQLLDIVMNRQEKNISLLHTSILQNEEKLFSKFENTPCLSVFE